MARTKQEDFRGRDLDELMAEYLAGCKELRSARAKYNERIHDLPWYFQPGPSLLHADGSMSGGNTWTPARPGAQLPSGHVMHRIRASSYDLERFYKHSGFERDLRAQQGLKEALARHDARIAERDEACVKVGVATARKAVFEAQYRLSMINVAVRKAPPGPVRLAFRLISDVSNYADGSLCFSLQYKTRLDARMSEIGDVLRDILSTLPPLIQKTASRIIKPGGGLVRSMPIWQGHSEFDAVHGFGRYPMLDDLPAATEQKVAA